MKQENRKESINNKYSNKFIKILFLFFIVIFVCSIVYLTFYLYIGYKDKIENQNIINNMQISIPNIEIADQKTERMLQLEELQKENNEIVGWLEIKDTNINYPVLQSTDNDYYLTHNYKKEYSISGSLFLDKDFNMNEGSSNYLIYGHRNKQGIMFEDLMKYSNEDFYKEHKRIKFTTNKEDKEYEILSVFYSRVYYQNEKNVFRYYYFVNAKNQEEYNNFVNECKKASIYDTGITATYGEQLLTLSTCEYSQEDGRFVVVCKKIN